MTATTILQADRWRAIMAELPRTHLLQSFEWGELKSRHGWTPLRLAWPEGDHYNAAACVLQRASPLGRVPAIPSAILYAPRGPLLDWCDRALRHRVLSDLEDLARARRAIFVKIDPEAPAGTGLPESGQGQPDPLGEEVAALLRQRGWRESAEQVQFRNTIRLDLSRSEDELLSAMKQKTRYNIRLAMRKGVRVRAGSQDDLDLLYRMYAETSLRDRFAIRPQRYYCDAWGSFMAGGLAVAFIAEVGDEPAAAIVVFRHGNTAIYMYGMSREAHRDSMPNHALQWEAIRWAKAQGCAVYDFWGAPDRFDEADRLWGVWRFKEGFGGQVVRTIGAWDYAPWPAAYRLYTRVLPRLLDVMRRRGRRQTQAALAG